MYFLTISGLEATKNRCSIPNAFQRTFRCDYCNSFFAGLYCLCDFSIKKPTYSTEIKSFCCSLYGLNYHVIGGYGCGQLKKMGQSTSMLLGTNSSSRIERGTIRRFEHEWRICHFWYHLFFQNLTKLQRAAINYILIILHRKKHKNIAIHQ